MFRTIELKLPYENELVERAKQFKDASQMFPDYGFKSKMLNKNKLKKGIYRTESKKVPTLPSAFVLTVRDKTSEMLKLTKIQKGIKKKSLSMIYDKRTFKSYSDSNAMSLSTVQGIPGYPIAHSTTIDKSRGEYTNAQAITDGKGERIFVMVQVEIPDREVMRKEDMKIVGMSIGMRNITAVSNNIFFNSKYLMEVKGRHRYLNRKQQHSNTNSARSKSKNMEERERRLVRDVNYLISKDAVSLPFDILALETLNPAGMKGNKHDTLFKCSNYASESNADINASRNIEVLCKSKYFRLSPASQSFRLDETPLIGGEETSGELQSFS